jgi:dolichyl-phosphate-mannose--protein O-mannosyl transferase
VPDALRSLWDYHQQMWRANTTLRAFHPYRSHPWSWLVLGRPTSFDYRGSGRGESGCHHDSCVQAISDLGNPVIWWGGTIALAVLVVVWLLGRDWRAGAILAGIAGGYLPWFLFSERTIYSFYAVAFGPYVVLALTFCLGLLLGPAGAPRERRAAGAAAAGGVVLLAVLAFAFFYPVLSDQLITHAQWSNRMWLTSWWWPEPNPTSTPT